jgi:UDP-N-acetylmuramyl pentapeptide synthase
MNHFREIAYLTDIARPDMAVISSSRCSCKEATNENRKYF